MLEWYEAYADYRDTMARYRGARRDASRAGGHRHDRRSRSAATRSTSRRRGAGCTFVEALEEHGLWTRDADELARAARGARRRHDARQDWAQLVDHAVSHFVEPSLIAADVRPRLPGRDLAVRAHDATTTRGSSSASSTSSAGWSSATRSASSTTPTSRRSGSRCRRRSGLAGTRGGAGRPGLRRGALVRDAADGRARVGDRPARDGAHGQDSIRDVILFPALRERQ